MALPLSSESEFTQGVITDRLEMQKTRPSLSVPIMSRNFILMNSRLSIPFEIIDEIIKIISWSNPNYTLSMLIIATNLILNPLWLIVSPLVYILYGIMSPAYLQHHPPEESVLESNPIPSRGLPLVDVIEPKLVPQLSREFVLNLTDLQNHMLLYVVVFDFLNWLVVEFCYFRNEAVSSFVFLILLNSTVGLSLLLPLVFKFLPVLRLFQLGMVTFIWSFLILLHPYFREQILTYFYSEDTRLKIVTLTNKVESKIMDELQYVEEQEIREVEIFEIQRLDPDTKNWSFLCYSSDFCSTNTVTRKLGLPIVGSQTLQLVRPPHDWDFVPNIGHSYQNENWKLDLNPQDWVGSNNAWDVIEIDEGEKWCYDKPENTKSQLRRRRWCREVIRSFQVQEILEISKQQESAIADQPVKDGKATANDHGYGKLLNLGSIANDEEFKRKNLILDTQYNNHMRRKSGNKR